MIIPNHPLLDLNAMQMKNADQSAAFMRPLIENALLTLPQGMPVGGEDSFKRFILAKKVHEGEEVTVEEAAFIKEACAKFCSPLAYGRITETIEGLASGDKTAPVKRAKA